VPRDVREAVPKGHRAVGGEVLAVPADVLPALLRRMRGLSVEFDADQVLVVKVVQVPDAGLPPAPGLAARLGQAVGALDALDVPALEREMNAFGGVREGLRQPGAPPELPARFERVPQAFDGGELPRDRTGNPGVGVVEGPGRRYQVEHGLLDRGSRKLPVRPRFSLAPGAAVDDHARDVLPSGGMARGRNRDVDLRAGLVGQALDLGGSLVAEHGTGPGAEHSRAEQCLPWRLTGERRVDRTVYALPPPGVHPPLDGSR
jgi:hypothetical protein